MGETQIKIINFRQTAQKFFSGIPVLIHVLNQLPVHLLITLFTLKNFKPISFL